MIMVNNRSTGYGSLYSFIPCDLGQQFDMDNLLQEVDTKIEVFINNHLTEPRNGIYHIKLT